MLVHVGAGWCMLVHVGASLHVHVGLLHVGVEREKRPWQVYRALRSKCRQRIG